MTPYTDLGRFISAFAMLTGTLVMALPVSVVGSTFNTMYNSMAGSTPSETAIQEDIEIACTTHLMPSVSGMPVARSLAAPVPALLKDRWKLHRTQEVESLMAAHQERCSGNVLQSREASNTRSTETSSLGDEDGCISNKGFKEENHKEQSWPKRRKSSMKSVTSAKHGRAPQNDAEYQVRKLPYQRPPSHPRLLVAVQGHAHEM
jgi:hypothetical protein